MRDLNDSGHLPLAGSLHAATLQTPLYLDQIIQPREGKINSPRGNLASELQPSREILRLFVVSEAQNTKNTSRLKSRIRKESESRSYRQA